MTNIVQTGNDVLRKTAEEVPLTGIKTPKIKAILNKMISALSTAKDGVALAAPQIGVSLRIFIALKEHTEQKKLKEKETDKVQEKNKSAEKEIKTEVVIFINPKIVKISKKKQTVKEGCLSVAGVFGAIERSEKVTLEAYNEKGEKFTRGASGLLAQIFQHEMDHLNGTLFIDTAYDLEKLENKKK